MSTGDRCSDPTEWSTTTLTDCPIGMYPLCVTERKSGLCVKLAAEVGEQFVGVKVLVEQAVALEVVVWVGCSFLMSK